jgi:hypothetical protein
LLAQKWGRNFSSSTLEEYSRRCLVFLDRYVDSPWRRYEDFCHEPELFMEEICDLLKISYTVDIVQRFGGIDSSGDSGRERENEIKPPTRRSISDEIIKEINASDACKLLINRLGY